MLGRESEGTVVATGSGEVYGFQSGDRVVCLSEATYAEYTAAPAAKAAKIPADLPPKIAAGALLQGLTALTLIREAAVIPKPRRPTRPTLASKERRLASKEKRGRTKTLRSGKPDD